MSPSGDSVSGPGKAYQVGGSIPANDRKRRRGARKGRPKRKQRHPAGSGLPPSDEPVAIEPEPVDATDADEASAPDQDDGEGHVNYLA